MNGIIPKYITTGKNTTRMVLWTALYAWLFITIYQPFNSRQWVQGVSDLTYFLFSTLAVLFGIVVIAASRTAMCFYTRKHDLTFVDYGIWVGGELIAMSLVYAFFPMIVVDGVTDKFFFLWRCSFTYTTFILLIPYAIVMLALIMLHYRDELDAAGLREAAVKAPVALPDMFNFYDERGELKLSIRPDALLYMEAADNYVQIHHVKSGKLNHFLLRTTLRQLEERFRDKDLIRCHRSFIINFSHVRMLKRTSEGLMIELDLDKIPNIPVSKTYADKVMERFTDERTVITDLPD